MLVQDMLSGYVHEVPDYGEPEMSGWPDPERYGLGEVYDGLGNPMGMFLLPKLISKAAGLFRGLLPGGGSPVPAPTARPTACPPCPACGGPMPPFPPPGSPYPYPMSPIIRRRRRRRR